MSKKYDYVEVDLFEVSLVDEGAQDAPITIIKRKDNQMSKENEDVKNPAEDEEVKKTAKETEGTEGSEDKVEKKDEKVEKKAETSETEADAKDTVTVEKSKLEDVLKRVEDLEGQLSEAKLQKRIDEDYKDLPLDADGITALAKSVEGIEDEKQRDAITKFLKEAGQPDARTQKGTTASVTKSKGETQLDANIKKRMEADSKLTYDEAFDAEIEANPELAQEAIGI